MSDNTTKTLGVQGNGNPSWNLLLQEVENGYHGLWRLAHKVWSSLSKSESMNSLTEDMLQEAVLSVYENIDSWDTSRSPVSWASVVMRNRIINLIDYHERQELDRLDSKAHNAMVEDDPGYKSAELRPEVEALRTLANGATRRVLDKILNDEPLTVSDRQRLKRFRAFIATHGISGCAHCHKPVDRHHGGIYCPWTPEVREEEVQYANP